MGTIDRWSEIVSLFESIANLPLEERLAQLERRCGKDIELKAAVQTLLRADAHASGFLMSSIRSDGNARYDHVSDEIPARVGPYRITKRIGRGGMGVVYLAEREEDFSRLVALKVLPDSADVRRAGPRFRMEREILSRLEHENIARLYDGGVDPVHGLYFAMEYVDGLSITGHCIITNRSLRERLELFLSVCAAVAYAHKNLVVHRDLKPQNILVDRQGVVKLLDFGISRILDEQSAEVNGSATRAMTPAYASPEQVWGGPVTTLSDIYSLGIVLFELLTGRRPFDVKSGMDAQTAADSEASMPPSPSQVVAHSKGEQVTSRELAGDVDRIVLKCLEVVPGRRYNSAEALAGDIELFLRGRPINSNSAGLSYVLGKFVRRNRRSLLVIATVSCVLVAAISVSIQSRIRLSKERATAHGLTSYLTELFSVADPSLRTDTTITYDEILAVAWREANRRLSHDAVVFASVSSRIGNLYSATGDADKAEQIHREALAGLGSEKTTVKADNLHGLGLALLDGGRFSESRTVLIDAFETQVAATGPESIEATDILITMAILARESGRLDEADSLASLAWQIRSVVLAPDDVAIAEALRHRAIIAREEGKTETAISLLQRAFATADTTDLRLSLFKADLLNSLGLLLMQEERFSEAEEAITESLTIKKKRLGASHPSVGVSLLNLAEATWFSKGPERGDSLAAAALFNLVSSRGGDHPDVSSVLNDMGVRMRRRGEFAKAESLYVRSLEIGRKSLGDWHRYIAATWNSLAVVLRLQGKLDRARNAYTMAVHGYRRNGPRMNVELSGALNGLGRVQLSANEREQSIASFRESLLIRQRELEPGHWRLGTAHSYYGYALAMTGASVQARRHLELGIRILSKALGTDDPKVKEAEERLNEFSESQVQGQRRPGAH